jgi:hypothetical protein
MKSHIWCQHIFHVSENAPRFAPILLFAVSTLRPSVVASAAFFPLGAQRSHRLVVCPAKIERLSKALQAEAYLTFAERKRFLNILTFPLK